MLEESEIFLKMKFPLSRSTPTVELGKLEVEFVDQTLILFGVSRTKLPSRNSFNAEEDGSETCWFLLATQTTVLFGIGNPLYHMPM